MQCKPEPGPEHGLGSEHAPELGPRPELETETEPGPDNSFTFVIHQIFKDDSVHVLGQTWEHERARANSYRVRASQNSCAHAFAQQPRM